jgi:hypothetical protein
MKEFIIKDSPHFQLRIKKQECLFPKDLYAINFIRCTKDKEGNIDNESTYEFFIEKNDLMKISKVLAE